MFTETKAFSGFSVTDLEAAQAFYRGILGLAVETTPMGLWLKVAGTNGIFVYPKPDHTPATYTILNFPVDNIDKAVRALVEKGVRFEAYPPMTGTDGIVRGIASGRGPDIAWFKDPAGNILSVLQEG